MKKNTEGLIMMERVVGDKSRLLTILTRDNGVVNCFVRNKYQHNSSQMLATRELSYARLSIFYGRNANTLDEASLIQTFLDMELTVSRVSLIHYFFELVIKTIPEQSDSSEQLDLLLNCLYLIKQGRPLPLIKTVFEIRFAMLGGWMPHLLYCADCGTYEDETMHFYYEDNILRCSKCHGEGLYCSLSKGALAAFRYVVFADPKKIFSFQVSPDSFRQLSDCAEKYITSIVSIPLGTLDYYHKYLPPDPTQTT